MIPTETWISTFGLSYFSTSFLILRNRNGLKIRCSYSITCLFLISFSYSVNSSLPPRLNHSSKSLLDVKISGSKKFNSDHNSCKLFCNGVPVSNSLYLESSYLSRCDIWLSSFLSLCASSTIKYSHLNFSKGPIASLTPSKVVKHTSNLPGCSWFLRISSLSSLVAIRLRTRHCGSHFLNSFFQFGITVFGTIIKK